MCGRDIMQATTVICALSAAAFFVAAGMFFYGKTSFAHDGSGLVKQDSSETIDYLNTEWMNRKGYIKISVSRGQMSLFFKDDEENKFSLSEGPVEVVIDDGKYVRKSDGDAPLSLYWNMKLKGKLLSAQLAVLDAPATYDTFARVGHEDDFPPLPVFAKSREEIKDKKLQSLSFTIGEFDWNPEIEEDSGKDSGFPAKWKNNYAASFRIECESDASETANKCFLRYGESDNHEYSISMGDKIALTDEQSQKFFELATVPGFLTKSPYRDSNGMSRPYFSLDFYAKFASGESAKIDSNHGFHADPDAVKDLWQYAYEVAESK